MVGDATVGAFNDFFASRCSLVVFCSFRFGHVLALGHSLVHLSHSQNLGKLHLEALTKAWVGVWVISLPMAVAGAYSVAIALGCTCMRVSSIA